MTVLVDTSVWIEYFRGDGCAEPLEFLIDNNFLVINDLILAELVPFLQLRRQKKLVSLLHAVRKISMDIDWSELMNSQYRCLKSGMNGVGIPDLIIAGNAKQHGCHIYTLDKHFSLLEHIVGIRLFTAEMIR